MLTGRVTLVALAYGLVVGFATVWWWYYSDGVLILNLPGTLVGDAVYRYSIEWLGNPHSGQAHQTVPWVLRLPQVYVPVSIAFWGVLGLALQAALSAFRVTESRSR